MATTYNTPTTDSAIKFKAGTYANLPAERDSNTLYFCTDTQQLFVGTDEYTRRLKTGAGAPSADATGTPTNGFYWDSTNNELYSNIGGTWTKIGTVKIMGAATSSTAGTAGLVPAPAAGKQTSFLRGDGTWVVPTDKLCSSRPRTCYAWHIWRCHCLCCWYRWFCTCACCR